MKKASCPRCRESHFATLCSDCLAEEIVIHETRSALHIGRCHRCGHVDAEPCPGSAGSSELMMTQASQPRHNALKGLTRLVASLATRATGVIISEFARYRQT